MRTYNHDPRSFKDFKSAVDLLSIDARLVFNRVISTLDSRTWRNGLFLLSHLRRADEEKSNPLLVFYQFQDDLPDPCGLAGRLGLTALEIVKQFGSLGIEADHLMEWLLDEDRLRLA